MIKRITLLITLLLPVFIIAQDLTQGLIVNDLSLRPMQDIAKPAYLNTIIDPSFGTTIRRISDAGNGGVIVPMYSTIQAWNTDESYMILYNQSLGYHELLDGTTYQFIRILDDVNPEDLEQIFWDFSDPNIFYYPEAGTDDFIKYSVATQEKQILVNLASISNCNKRINMGNDIQMMSWDSDVFTFRCDNESAYSYRISTDSLITFDIADINSAAPGVAPSGELYYHESQVYDNLGNSITDLNISSVEHSCIGKISNGNDAYFAIAFAQGPQGGCIGDIIAHDLGTGLCTPLISQGQGYDYPQSGTHISSLAHKNTDGAWLAASMMGYDQNGQELLDQELVIVKADVDNVQVCRIGHHRSDEDEYEYWGEPHAVISPTGTRVLFASDWSGSTDGESIDSYVVELPAYSNTVATNDVDNSHNNYKVIPNPVNEHALIEFENPLKKQMSVVVYNANGKKIIHENIYSNSYEVKGEKLDSGLYFFKITDFDGVRIVGKFVKQQSSD